MKKRGKKGLSTIVITLIIILVSLVAVGIIWVVVRNVIQQGSEGIAMGQFTLDAKIMNVNLENSLDNINLTVKRNPGEGEFTSLKFIFYDGKDSEVITEVVSLNQLEERRFNFHLTILNVSRLVSISIVPILNKNGKDTIGNVLDKYTISGNEQTQTQPPGSCTPTTCSALGYLCGTWSNGTCSGTLNCGTCGTGYICNASGRCVQSTCNISSLTWQNNPITSQNGWFVAVVDATPYNNSMDGVFGLSQGAQTTYPGFSALFRFNVSGYIDVFNGDFSGYRSLQLVPYTANTKYNFRFIVNITSQRYDVYVTPQGGSQVLLASNYGFRTPAISINNRGLIGSSLGTFNICDFNITSSNAASNLCNGLVLLMHFDNNLSVGENSTFVYDWSGNGNYGFPRDINLTNLDGNTPPVFNVTNGRFNLGAGFDGIDDYIRIPRTLSLTPNFSNGAISAWVYLNSSINSISFISSYNYGVRGTWNFGKTWGSNRFFSAFNSSGGEVKLILYDNVNLQLDTWTHYIVTWNDSGIYGYINGNLESMNYSKEEFPYFRMYNSNGNYMSIGMLSNGDPPSSSWAFRGKIDDFAIWNKSLTTEEISNIYNSATEIKC